MSKMPHIAAIIQARFGSSRLPGKTLEILFEKSLLEHIVERISASKQIQSIIVATTKHNLDDSIVDICKRMGLSVYRGSEDNVLERFYDAATRYNSDIIVRVTADDPFKDPQVIDKAISLLLEQNYDYCSNTIEPSYPEGIDIEVFRYRALQQAYKNASLLSEKEHVTPYIWKNKELFSVFNFKNKENLSHLRWTIDYYEDLVFARKIYKILYPKKPIFLMKDILELLETHPEFNEINSGKMRNEGYIKSLMKEQNQ